MSAVELTNMVMIEDKQTGCVVVQECVKRGGGISFPGGHVEPGESFVDSAIREVKEETGLCVRNLKNCGVLQWCNTETNDRYLVFLYKTSDFSGTLVLETEEGRVYWRPLAELKQIRNAANDFEKFLPMFLEETYSEAFVPWGSPNLDSSVFYK